MLALTRQEHDQCRSPASTPSKRQPAAVSRAVTPDNWYQFIVSLVTWLVIVVSLSAVVLTTWVSFAG